MKGGPRTARQTPNGEKCLSIKFVVKLTACLALSALCSSALAAQQTTPPASADSPAQTQPQDADKDRPQPSSQQAAQQPADEDKGKASTDSNGEGKVAGTSNDRLFYTLPNFLTLQNAGQLPPLSMKDKFEVVALGTFDPVQYPWWGLLSAIGQASNSEPAYGQGWASYGKRYGTIAADSTIENFMVGAVFPSILRQDPRFYQSGHGGWEHRTGYAISRIFVTKSDSGRRQFNYSEIFGAALAGAISTYSYHPTSTYISTPSNPHMFVASDRTLSNAGQTWATQIGLDTATLVVKEFWPDIHRKIRKHKEKSAAAEQARR